MGKLSKLTAQLPFGRTSQSDTEGSQSEKQKYAGPYDNGPVPRVTIHSFIMGVFVSMGGFIFGYDTGQISGFLGMAEFQQRFGQRSDDLVTNPSGYYFSNVRSGLIVALVRLFAVFQCVNLTIIVINWYFDGCSDRRTSSRQDRTKMEYFLLVFDPTCRIDSPDDFWKS